MKPGSSDYSVNKNLNSKPVVTCNDTRHLWSIILAGGNGDRISDLTHQWMGRKIPKQYCSFVGKQSMLQNTIARAEKLGARERVLTLVARAHREDARAQLASRWKRGVVVQPSNRDTLPGIFLPLTHAYARDPMATVAIQPSDHFIHPQERFLRVMKRAIQAAEEMPHLVLLIGVPANSLELDYGWICPGQEIWTSGKYSVLEVRQFLEKPSHDRAAAAMAVGGMWNTLIIVAKAHTLWRLGSIWAPEILRRFERLYQVIDTSWEQAVLESIYETMPSRNFSTDLLTRATNQIGVMQMKDVLWSDWGRKERIIETLRLIGKQPNFPIVPAAGSKPLGQGMVSRPIAS